MLRRYLIVNGATSALLYLVMWTCVPSMAAMSQTINETWNSYVMGHTFLGPVLNRMITVGANLIGLG